MSEEQEHATEPRFEIPASLKTILAKLPSPEAIKVIEDIGRVAWVIDNNNNNNKKSLLEDRFLDKLSVLAPERLTNILKE